MNNGSNIKKPSLDDPNVPSFTKTMMDQNYIIANTLMMQQF